MEKAFKAAARAVLPVWKTTPVPVLHRESGIPPASVALAQARLRNAARLAKLDNSHPICRRADGPTHIWPKTWLQRTASLAWKTVRPTLFTKKPTHVHAGLALTGLGKDRRAKTKHLEWVHGVQSATIVAYSDGSQIDKRTGWGVVVYHEGNVLTRCGPLPNAEVFDAEATGAVKAMELAREIRKRNRFVSEAHFFLDNSSVVDGFLGEAPVLSQGEFWSSSGRRTWHPARCSCPGYRDTKIFQETRQPIDLPNKARVSPPCTSSDGREVRCCGCKVNTGITICQKATVDGNLMPSEPLELKLQCCTDYWRKDPDTAISTAITRGLDMTLSLNAGAACRKNEATSCVAEWLGLSCPYPPSGRK